MDSQSEVYVIFGFNLSVRFYSSSVMDDRNGLYVLTLLIFGHGLYFSFLGSDI